MGTILERIIDTIKVSQSEQWQAFDITHALDLVYTDANRRIPHDLIFPTDAFFFIAEMKKASPSQGVICKEYEPTDIATSYQKANVDAISVLTEQTYFSGHEDHLRAVRRTVDIPILRKDFIVHPYQVHEAYLWGADIVLLIVAALDDAMLLKLHGLIKAYGMTALVEVHNTVELERALSVNPSVIGINNRDLHTFTVNLEVTKTLIPHVPDEIKTISESGIFTEQDAEFLYNCGADGLLVGQSVLETKNREACITMLKHAGRNKSTT